MKLLRSTRGRSVRSEDIVDERCEKHRNYFRVRRGYWMNMSHIFAKQPKIALTLFSAKTVVLSK